MGLLQELLMSGEQLSYELYKWLSGCEVLPGSLRYKSNGNFELDRRSIDGLVSGSLIGKLLVQLAAEHGAAINGPLIASIKQSNTPAARVYNWNILAEGFAKMAVNISKETQKEITSGNFQSLTRFLLQLHKRFNPKKAEKKEEGQEQVNLKRVQVLQHFSEAETFLQAIILLISENFSLTPKQTMSTLAENAKYYAHMVVKGIKNSYSEVLGLIQAMITAMPQLMFLCEKSPEKNTQFFMDLIKPTLISRQAEVAKKGARLFKVFLGESLKYNSKNLVYQLLCREGAGFDFLYMGLKRHPDLAEDFSQFLELLVGGAFKDFFEVHLKRTINNEQEYLKILLKMLEGLVRRPESKGRLKAEGLIEVWLRNSEESFANRKSKEENLVNEETKLLYLQLLCFLWREYSGEIDQEEAEELLMRGIEELKRNTRKDIYTIKIPALLRLFDFLHYLADCKNKVAPILYKKLIFLLIQNHQEEQIREIILSNFTIMLRSYPTIPVDFLLDPFLRQLINCEGRSYILNVFDFEFMLELCRHPKMDAIYGLSYLEYFSKLYIKSFIYARLVIRLVQVLTGRFCEEETIVEFLKRNVDSTLNLYGILVMNKKKMGKEDAIINKQKKALAIELIKRYVELEHRELGTYIQEKVAGLYGQWVDQRNNTDKGLRYLLNLFGDADEIVLQHRLAQNRRFQSVPINVASERTEQPQQHEEKVTPKSDSYKEQEYMKEKGIGYKPDRRGSKTRMEEMLERAVGKPNPKVLKDIESLKEKMKEDASRKQMQQNNELKKMNHLNSQHSIQLLQRNLSLGYAKLAPLQEDKILFDFDSVKQKQLKMTVRFHALGELQQQDERTAEVVLKQYSKEIKALFQKYALISSVERKEQSTPMMSFTEVVKMTKEKNIPLISKLALSDMIASINHPKRKEKNVLSGIQEPQFNEFLIKLTDFVIQEERNAMEVPFGVRLEGILKVLFQGEPFYDNRMRVKEPQNIGKIREQLNREEEVEIPEGYRKVRENQIELKYRLRDSDWGVGQRYQIGYEIADWLVERCIGVHVITPIVEVNQRYNLLQVPKPIKLAVPKQATDPKIKYLPEGNSEFIILPKDKESKNSDRVRKSGPNQRSLSHRVINKTKTEAVEPSQEQKEKVQKQLKYAEKLRENLQKMKQEKAAKEDQEKVKKQEEKRKQAKREEERKKYLQQNKEKLKQLKMKEQEQRLAKENEQKLQKQKQKNEYKKKQQQLLQKQKEAIKHRAEKLNEKKRQLQNSRQKKAQNLQRLAKEVIASKNDTPNDRLKMLQLKNSLENGALKQITTKYEKPLTELFQAYWTWDKKRIDLNSFALIFKDFKLSPELVYPKVLAETFKTTARGPSLDFEGFKECLMKCAYRSQKLQEEHPSEGESLNLQVARAFLSRLKVQSPSYREILKQRRGQI